MEDNDDDYFSDDFDSLPPGTLYQLEQNAFQSTQAPAIQQHDQSIINGPVQRRPSAHALTSLKPPPRLHTGLTNDYNTLEVGELEAEVHDNVDGQSLLPQGHQVLVADNGWPVSGGMGDVMEVDDDYGQANTYEMNARLEQVGNDLQVFHWVSMADAHSLDGARTRTNTTPTRRGKNAGRDESWRNSHHPVKTDKNG